jgi:hypothetical protein
MSSDGNSEGNDAALEFREAIAVAAPKSARDDVLEDEFRSFKSGRTGSRTRGDDLRVFPIESKEVLKNAGSETVALGS